MLAPLLIASKAKQQMERSVKSEYCPPVRLEDIGTVSIHLATLNEEAFIEPTLQTLVSQK